MIEQLKKLGAEGTEDVEIANFDGIRGLKTLVDSSKGTPILTIPRNCCWSADMNHPVVSKLITNDMSKDDKLSLFLMYYRSTQPNSSDDEIDRLRYEHIKLLPKEYKTGLYYTEAELNLCVGSSFYHTIIKWQKQVEEDYNQLMQNPSIAFFADIFSFENYKWALSTIWSRGMDFEDFRAIVPLADMINHSFDGCIHIYNPDSGYIQIVSNGLDAGAQICINYGSQGNKELARLYGFTLDHNPYDTFELYLSTPDYMLFHDKVSKFKQHFGSVETVIHLSLSDPLPEKLVDYLRLQSCDEQQLVNFQPGKQISRENDYHLFESLVNILFSIDDQITIQDMKCDQTIVSKTEKKILQACISKIRSVLVEL